MNYDLAKQLSIEGFQLKAHHDNDFANVTLEELIEACGDGFRELIYHSKRTEESTYRRWTAHAGTRNGKTMVAGKTPSEAVAKLWLKLNLKEN